MNKQGCYDLKVQAEQEVKKYLDIMIPKKYGDPDTFGDPLTLKNRGENYAYTVISGLDKKFLEDPKVAAGLAVIIGTRYFEATVAQLNLSGDSEEIRELLAEVTQTNVKEISEFYKDQNDYQLRLEKLLKQVKTAKPKNKSLKNMLRECRFEHKN